LFGYNMNLGLSSQQQAIVQNIEGAAVATAAATAAQPTAGLLNVSPSSTAAAKPAAAAAAAAKPAAEIAVVETQSAELLRLMAKTIAAGSKPVADTAQTAAAKKAAALHSKIVDATAVAKKGAAAAPLKDLTEEINEVGADG
jgi:hypothetical protein